MLIYKRNVHTKNESSSYIGAEKITFPTKPDGQTDRWTDISVYRVASLLKMNCFNINKEATDKYSVLFYLVVLLTN